MAQEWITDRPPTAADGDGDGDVRRRYGPGSDDYNFAHWSHVGTGAPWQRTSCWRPPTEPTPTEPDRITALEQRVGELKRGEDAVGLLYSHLQSRLAKLEGVQDDGSAPKWTLNRIADLEQRVAELEATMQPSAELAEDISYQQLKVEQMRTSAALLIAHANLIEAQP
jgi:uncharacterized coiled-coil protein SlyX